MYKKHVTYIDYNGNEQEEDLYFNLSKAEVDEMMIRSKEGLDVIIQRMIDEQDGDKLFDLFKEILLKSYGEKSEDGKYFIKDPERSKMFAFTEAYGDLVHELVTDADEAARFINSIIPKINTEQSPAPKS